MRPSVARACAGSGETPSAIPSSMSCSVLRPLGLTPAQAEVIAVLRDAPEPLSVREIGERLVCETGSPSRLVGSVVAAGLARRAEHPSDRRAVVLSLTQAGSAVAR